MIVVKPFRNLLTTSGITGQQYIPSHISRLDLQMKFLFRRIDNRHSNVLLSNYLISIIVHFPTGCNEKKTDRISRETDMIRVY